MKNSRIIILMGVSAAGKTTIGHLLERSLEAWQFFDADDFHSVRNKEKIQHGTPLTDEDRRPWLLSLHALIEESIHHHRSIILACSALKSEYRRILTDSVEPYVDFIYLKIDPATSSRRSSRRTGHFAGPNLVESQFRDLEEPERAVVVDAEAQPQEIVNKIIMTLHLDAPE